MRKEINLFPITFEEVEKYHQEKYKILTMYENSNFLGYGIELFREATINKYAKERIFLGEGKVVSISKKGVLFEWETFKKEMGLSN